jgi:tRNA A37 threonylcarbamoyladenosine dehydratase
MKKYDGKQFERTEFLLGKDILNTLSKSTVAIFGLGGVGSFATEGLVRTGIGNFILFDFDKINITNFNRQITATEENIGIDKATVMEKRIKSINPEAGVKSFINFLHKDTLNELLNMEKIDFCIEAIDSYRPKISVIKILLEREIPFISSMGAGGRKNPALVKTGTLSEVKTCNLAKRIKKELRKGNLPLDKIPVVYSMEESAEPLQRNLWEEGEFQRGRVRSKLGSICFVPAVFGMLMAHRAVEYLSKSEK